jgi:hypothetical protein
MKKGIIHVTINPDGTVEVAPVGFKGKQCKDKTKFLEQALGMEDAKSKLTSEFYESEQVKIGQRT